MTAHTVTAPNLSTASNARAVEFTVEGVLSLAWKKARMINFVEAPTADMQSFAREWLNVKLDRISSEARITRAVYRLEVPTVADTTSYELDASVFDVIGVATYQAAADGSETQMRPMGRDEFMRISEKESEGRPTRYYPERGSTVTVFPWPVPSEDDGTMVFQAVKWLRDASAGSQTLDVERYFVEYLVTALAYEIAMANSIDLEYCRELKASAERDLLPKALGYSKQRGPTQAVVTHRTGWSGGRRR